VYVAGAKVAFALAFVQTSIAPIWPPSGIALAAVLLLGRRAVPGVALGALLVNASTPVPLWVSAAIALGNTLEALAGAWLLRRAAVRPSATANAASPPAVRTTGHVHAHAAGSVAAVALGQIAPISMALGRRPVATGTSGGRGGYRCPPLRFGLDGCE
jgi:integral membrane sensor domain MASE1